MQGDFVNHLWQQFLTLLFPITCAACGKEEQILCRTCFGSLGRPVNELADIEAPLSYREKSVSKAVWKLKYAGLHSAGVYLGELLGEHVLDDLAEDILLNTSMWQIVPVPLSPKRLQKRGYNQAELLAKGVSNVTGIDLNATLVKKTRETLPQVQVKNRAARLNNLTGAFSLNTPIEAKGRSFIVIDDVHTTGTTIREISRVLLDRGAREVRAYTLAH